MAIVSAIIFLDILGLITPVPGSLFVQFDDEIMKYKRETGTPGKFTMSQPFHLFSIPCLYMLVISLITEIFTCGFGHGDDHFVMCSNLDLRFDRIQSTFRHEFGQDLNARVL